VLAASALAGAADEPASNCDNLPTEVPAPVVAAAQDDGVRLRSAEATESTARSLVAGHSRVEIAQIEHDAATTTKKARPAVDEADAPLLFQREKSASGRTLKPFTRRRNLDVEK